jgi:hypothetical protein
MNAKVMILAVAVAIIALPVPASQLLNGAFSPSTQASPAAVPSSKNLGLLLQDPFLIDRLSYTAPKSFVELGAPAI